MDLVGLALVVLSLSCSILSASMALKTYKALGSGFFRYLTFALLCFALLPIGYLFQIFITDPAQIQLVIVGTLGFNIMAYIGLACIVAAVEYLKKRPNELVIDLSFLFAGIIVAERFLPSFQEMTWNGVYWKMIFKFPLMVSFAIFYIYVMIMTLPFLLRIWKRIRAEDKFASRIRGLFFLMIIALAYSAIVLMLNRGETFSNIDILAHPQGYLIFVAIATLFVYVVLKESPTLFFTSTDDIIHLGIVRTKDNQPLFDYSFVESTEEIQSFLVTGVQSTLGTVFQEVIQGSEDLKQIRRGHDIITIVIGRNITGFVLAQSDIEVLGPLLSHTLSVFEKNYGHEILARNAMPEFEATVKSIFHFALSSDQSSRRV